MIYSVLIAESLVLYIAQHMFKHVWCVKSLDTLHTKSFISTYKMFKEVLVVMNLISETYNKVTYEYAA